MVERYISTSMLALGLVAACLLSCRAPPTALPTSAATPVPATSTSAPPD